VTGLAVCLVARGGNWRLAGVTLVDLGTAVEMVSDMFFFNAAK